MNIIPQDLVQNSLQKFIILFFQILFMNQVYGAPDIAAANSEIEKFNQIYLPAAVPADNWRLDAACWDQCYVRAPVLGHDLDVNSSEWELVGYVSYDSRHLPPVEEGDAVWAFHIAPLIKSKNDPGNKVYVADSLDTVEGIQDVENWWRQSFGRADSYMRNNFQFISIEQFPKGPDRGVDPDFSIEKRLNPARGELAYNSSPEQVEEAAKSATTLSEILKDNFGERVRVQKFLIRKKYFLIKSKEYLTNLQNEPTDAVLTSQLNSYEDESDFVSSPRAAEYIVQKDRRAIESLPGC